MCSLALGLTGMGPSRDSSTARQGCCRISAAAVAAVLLLAVPLASYAIERTVVVVPLGHVDKALLDVAAQAIESTLNVRVRIDPEREMPNAALYTPRGRYRAERILAAVDASLPEGAWKVVAMTDAEISTTKGAVPDWRVGGLGSIGGPSCVVSTWIDVRHSKTREVLHRRLADLVVHELGHALGLDHCPVAGCVMRDAKGKILETADSSTGELCSQCRKRLGAQMVRGAADARKE
jgi:archaemetzincin